MRGFLRAVCVAVLAGGCGGGGGRQPVSGSVTVGGKPLDHGSVTFLAGEAGGAVGGAPVTAGRFTLPAEHGLAAGPYRVSISAPVPGGTPTPAQKAAGASPNAKESLPAKYNDRTELTATVEPGGKNDFTFALD